MTYLKKPSTPNTKPGPAGLSPRIIRQASLFLPKMPHNCCTYRLWTVLPYPKPLWATLTMGKNPTQQPNIDSFLPSEKSPLTDLNLLLSKRFISSPSNSNFQAIILCNLHL